jgi:hypothetical protein
MSWVFDKFNIFSKKGIIIKKFSPVELGLLSPSL